MEIMLQLLESIKLQGLAYQTKVGQEVVVSVTKECNLYDMYLSASEEDKALFGIIFSEDGRSFKATKSPDNVTDATIDLEVYTLPNIVVTAISRRLLSE